MTGVIADDAADASDGDVVQPRRQTIVVVDGLRDQLLGVVDVAVRGAATAAA